MIPRKEIPALEEAIRKAVNEHGHPDELEQANIEGEGISPDTAEVAFALLTSDLFPTDPGEAVAKWLRLIGEYSEGGE
jgi:hypothetical protein